MRDLVVAQKTLVTRDMGILHQLRHPFRTTVFDATVVHANVIDWNERLRSDDEAGNSLELEEELTAASNIVLSLDHPPWNRMLMFWLVR